MIWWLLAMLALVPLLRRGAMLRTWATLALACMAAWVLPFAAAFIAIDAVAGAIVMRRPAGLAQKAIGMLFVAMLCFETGFILSPGMNAQAVQDAGIFFGWVQWLFLFSWSLYDHLGLSDRVVRPIGNAVVVKGRVSP